MDIQDREPLERFVREHHVHYDVEPQTAIQGKDQRVVGYEVRLLATHGESKLEAPACPRCVELLSGLQSFAERIVSSADAASWAEIVPEPAVLYQSTEESGADEVALTVRILRDTDDDRGSEHADPRLTAIRKRLEAVGVPRRP